MKRKNIYVGLTILWAFITVIDITVSVVNFVSGNLITGTVFLVASCAVAFVCGILFRQAVEIYKYNKACQFLEDVSEFLHEKIAEEIQPFDELKGEEK